ncbi:hypothetical protein COL87_11060 [Bacillus pseudomycoides]|nr:hypothetical protein BLX05_00245 [Bacillus pseudomycoides]PEB41388.1 hypothetical protein COO06_12850 [Bacillus pseudomycoides]PEF76706.1 hypothetical protein CON94_03290 [Bacillus pseudomycoides]PEI46016.1 hypothetical protein CN641_13680 [Bacillus pseudomycoides]PEL86232.1 hypothetical protein CN615_14925 [Bacillus pseudomycoides]
MKTEGESECKVPFVFRSSNLHVEKSKWIYIKSLQKHALCQHSVLSAGRVFSYANILLTKCDGDRDQLEFE